MFAACKIIKTLNVTAEIERKSSSLRINSETTCFNLAFYSLVTNISFKRRRQKLQIYSQTRHMISKSEQKSDWPDSSFSLFMFKNNFKRQRNHQFMLKTKEIITENYQFNKLEYRYIIFLKMRDQGRRKIFWETLSLTYYRKCTYLPKCCMLRMNHLTTDWPDNKCLKMWNLVCKQEKHIFFLTIE